MNQSERENIVNLSLQLREIAEDAPKDATYEKGRTKGSIAGRVLDVATQLEGMAEVTVKKAEAVVVGANEETQSTNTGDTQE